MVTDNKENDLRKKRPEITVHLPRNDENLVMSLTVLEGLNDVIAKRKKLLVEYLKECVSVEDWNNAHETVCKIREVECEIKCLKSVNEVFRA